MLQRNPPEGRLLPDPDARTGASHRRPIGNQRTCRIAAERLTVDLAWIYERLVEITSRAPYQEEIRTSDKLRALDMLIRLGGFYAPEKKIVAPADSKSVRLTQVFDGEQLKARMTAVELLRSGASPR